ncbi:DUF58 domain-containing protein [Listeria costaricensis]|uniref:DUF58 domain-containing protein n=1 Tax=Listeria costaricensis TaxID=2026604 RepID=UPI000C071002|nr:DUF58 domain-containing protein [Listeria costaricensis]
MTTKRALLLMRFGVFLLLYVALWTYTLFQGDFASWFLTYFFSFILLLLVCGSLFRLKNWQIKRDFHKARIQEGETVRLTVHFARKRAFPMGYLLMQQAMPETLGNLPGRQQVIYPFFKRSITADLAPFTAVRGKHVFPAVEAETSDPFGLMERSARLGEAVELTIYPRYFPDILMKISENSPENERNATNWTFKKNQNIHGLREFTPGDRISWIDWKSSAKTGKVMAREYENSSSSRVRVIFYGQQHPHFDFALRAAYSFARKMLEQNGEVSVAVLGENGQTFGFSRGHAKLEDIAKAFAEVAPATAEKLAEPLTSLLAQNQRTILFTPFVDPALQKAVRSSVQKQTIQLVSILDGGQMDAGTIYLPKKALALPETADGGDTDENNR